MTETQAPSSPEHERLKQRVLLCVVLTVFLDLVGFGLVIPLLKHYVESMNASESWVGPILSSFSLAQFLVTPTLGRLSDRYGRRKVILISLVGNAIAMIVFALGTELRLLPLLIASRVLAGATAGNLSACQAAIADVTRQSERAGAMGRLGSGISLGIILGPVIGGTLFHLAPWAPPVAAAAMAVFDVILTFFLMPETLPSFRKETGAAPADAHGTQKSSNSGPKQSFIGLLFQRPMGYVLLLGFFTFVCLMNIQAALPSLADHRFKWKGTTVGVLFGLFGGMNLLVQGFLLGRLAKRYGEINLIIAGAILNALGMICIALAHTPSLLFAGIVILGIGVAITNPLLASIASKFAPENQQGEVLGIAQSAGTFGRIVGPTASSTLLARVNDAAPFFNGAIVSILSLILGVLVRLHAPKPVQQAAKP